MCEKTEIACVTDKVDIIDVSYQLIALRIQTLSETEVNWSFAQNRLWGLV